MSKALNALGRQTRDPKGSEMVDSRLRGGRSETPMALIRKMMGSAKADSGLQKPWEGKGPGKACPGSQRLCEDRFGAGRGKSGTLRALV